MLFSNSTLLSKGMLDQTFGTPMLNVTLLIITLNGNQPKCPSTKNEENVVQKYNVIPCSHKLVKSSITLEITVLNEVSQAEKEKYDRLSH